MNKKIKNHSYWFIIKIDGIFFAYNSITRKIKKIFLTQLGRQIREKSFLNLSKKESIKLNLPIGREKEIIDNYLSNKKISIQNIFLMVSLNCNQACRYCLCRGQNYSNSKLMSQDIAFRGVDLLAKNYNDNNEWQQITFYGGEPLMNKKIVKKTILYARQKQKKGLLSSDLAIIINTNGLLLDENLIEFFENNDVEIQLSFDGIPKIHDKNRVLKNGGNSSQRLIKVINMLSKYKVKIIPMITITEENINDLANSLKWLYERIKFKEMSLNILIQGTMKTKKDFGKRTFESIVKAYKWAQTKNIIDYGLSELISTFYDHKLILPSCGAASSKITILPDGIIIACQALGLEKINTVGSLSKISKRKRKNWLTIDPIVKESCHSCEAISICGGGCPRASFYKYGNIKARDDFHCQFIKSFLVWIVEKELFNKNKKKSKDKS